MYINTSKGIQRCIIRKGNFASEVEGEYDTALVRVIGNVDYTTVIGGTERVPLLEAVTDGSISKPKSVTYKKAIPYLREWTSKDGKHNYHETGMLIRATTMLCQRGSNSRSCFARPFGPSSLCSPEAL